MGLDRAEQQALHDQCGGIECASEPDDGDEEDDNAEEWEASEAEPALDDEMQARARAASGRRARALLPGWRDVEQRSGVL